MEQLILHLIGDYLTQSDWMALNKTKRDMPALAHAIVYSIPFWMLGPSLIAWLVIAITHYFIDRYRLARYVVWAKNFLSPGFKNLPWAYCKMTGYDSERPDWLAVWLLIIADNTLHLAINYAALRWL